MATGVTIAATEVSGWRARLTIVVTDPVGGSTLTVERVTGTTVTPVMGGTAIAAQSVTLDDALAPLHVSHVWRATLSTGQTATSAPLVFAPPWAVSVLSDPYSATWVEVVLNDWQERRTASRSTEIRIEGDPQPVTVEETDEVERSPLRIETATVADIAELATLTDQGSPFFLRPDLPEVAPAWLRSTDGRRTTRPMPWTGVSYHEYGTLHIRQPSDIAAVGNTQADLAAVFATQGDLEAHPTIDTQADLETVDLKAMV